MKTDTAPGAPEQIFLKDYQPPAYAVRHTRLEFALSPTHTQVTARLMIGATPATGEGTPLVLHGEMLTLKAIRIDGITLDPDAYIVNDKTLTIPSVPLSFTLETEVEISPATNTALSGLYMSNGMFCTQCEAEGFRRITYYPDRPDVLSTFDVRLEADKKTCPVLLANGNPDKTGDLEDGRHYAEWSDPHPKPAYLFALVAGDLAHADGSFKTSSGREVLLQVFVQPENIDKCDYTLDSLKRAMRWDEEVFGREYDLDIFMIVAVDHFNFGAMENKGLNIFNSAYVLASPQTATDADYELIESIVAHEYFHNWSGNRVTCRDWFQLCLKEGFTVFRDQEFSADMRSRAVQRIRDVNRLWQRQFAEDAGPLAHPVRPESYITIDNFYTATIYEKGAELVRMMKTFIGPEKFRAATNLYFDRHDGEAATVENFIICMEEAGQTDLTQFRHWYRDAGTPLVSVTENWDAASKIWTLTLHQSTQPTPGQIEKPPRHMPVRLNLIGQDGPIGEEHLLNFTQASQNFTFKDLNEHPVPSLFCSFSAPVTIAQELTIDARTQLLRHDPDSFNRWSTARRFALDLIRAFAGEQLMDAPDKAMRAYSDAICQILSDDTLDPAFRATLLTPPSETDIARAVSTIDPAAIAAARQKFRRALLSALDALLLTTYHACKVSDPYSPSAGQAGQRALRNACLALLLADESDAGTTLAMDQINAADNMTDEAVAVFLLAMTSRPERQDVLDNFYTKWKNEPLVINKWLTWQATSSGPQALEKIKALIEHEAFDFKNPNKVRALIGAFAMENLTSFHQPDGAGYTFLFEIIRTLDPINPMVAARLLTAAESWKKLEPNRREKLGTALKELAGQSNLSENVYEMATRLAS